MNAQALLDAIGSIRDQLPEEAARPPRRRAVWGGLAAGLAAVIAGALWMTRPALPMLTIGDAEPVGMGFEGYMAYDISELQSGIPWTPETVPDTLPVYENPLAYNENGIQTGGDFEAMEAYLRELAARLGADPDALEITDNTPDAAYQEAVREKMELAGGTVPEGYFDPTCLIAQWEGMEIRVDRSMTAEISLEPGLKLPEDLAVRSGAGYEEAAAAGEWLAERYASLLGMTEPQVCISGGDYNIYRQQSYTIEVCDAAGKDLDRTLSRSFRQASFYLDEEGELFLIRLRNPDLSRKAGDYPILSPEEAQALLLKGHYVTSVPEELPGEEWIARTELIYRNGPWDQTWMPWYRFYVELPDMEAADGLKTYGAYYVPAVEERYIANMPTWDGSF